jgi:anthranilate/para-aminobenzoate synthase component II
MERKSHNYEFSTTVLYYHSWLNLSIFFQMKIAISQREITIRTTVYDCLERGWYNLLNKHEIMPIPNDHEYDISSADCFIMSGGETTESREFTETYCFRQAVEKGIPIIGVCHGAFVLNRWFDGTNEIVSGHDQIDHEVFLDNEWQTVNSYHRIKIDTLADQFSAIAHDSDNNVEAFKHQDKLIWGLVWHPERMDDPVLPKDLKDLLYG